VEEADHCGEWGQVGAMLRREGLYHSHLDKWRKQRDAGALDALNPRKRGPKTSAPHHLTKENEQLRRENTRLGKKLKKAEMVIEFQKKVAALLEMDPTDEGSA
jgi:transposase-like protein